MITVYPAFARSSYPASASESVIDSSRHTTLLSFKEAFGLIVGLRHSSCCRGEVKFCLFGRFWTLIEKLAPANFEDYGNTVL